MKNLLEKDGFEDITNRVFHLQPEQQAQWGKMNVAQMMAHLQKTFEVPLSEKPMPRMMIGRLIGWMIKPKLYNETPWKPNLPTAPNFIINEERDFATEKLGLLNLIEEFHTAGPEKIGRYPHPMFGNITKDQWGKAMYKHADHHLQQFGVN
ncbi:MAG: DUF1569 domain-containing protein [Ferruginibacter sp.]